jgi:hypothetical protein
MNPFVTTTNDATAMVGVLAVTPNDGADLVPPSGPARPTRAIMVSGAGAVALTFADGSTATITIPATATGFLIALAVTRVRSTGTTATLITAYF